MITLASDFGMAYPAAMKGVILSRTDARLVDVAHDLPRQDVRAAAFWLRETLPYFPPAVHLVVVDPGVGTDRRAIALRVGEHVLVGPDNGVLRPPARRIIEKSDEDARIEAYEIRVSDPDSTTFHGRDVFAPAAADAHKTGASNLDSIDRFAPVATDSLTDLRFPTPDVARDGTEATGEVLVVDDFGNCITNVPGDFVRGSERIAVDGESVPIGHTFEAVPRGDRLVTVGSHGNVECDVNHGRGDEAFGLAPGDTVRLQFD
ncbi:S-adenosyl-l-methionine hydroxide adenosyltransferase [Haloferax mediterranei ATCC 33500]|uniref:NAD operon protein n=1 Tax=Haloferax mediterranei (strain ATCC 33500 / DSM 1411 / JCM 8866 / NBRC 14739 / NCIMB 2177 / R-4) TaxID=523841 RepID=I3R2K3_HALMT|nr:SAM-dependent chlorinase/fluorinase [Haloferax mediterranei]AFK18463.1 NAD operon protein [Haloferax mediterranei ATCC 33500]AHZ22152.1 S-adenosylmethionine hydroxide adenosyltransferase [Haloferax mediterranei ATCC 33500]EMA02263.1 NAD operon protein [Haloferax mediterranei ATCC 33500]MDX5988554.1 SAM-dependent chlorinase/fluorinase [Haloferax mediterranei ATCC 33500]QCQ74967.1 S-adenosyl-l-methionine hydroxide adenosyltransferase [Haloferax mediterranei ATCC 33500]